MNKSLPLLLACAAGLSWAEPPQYQVGASGVRQAREEAEQRHARGPVDTAPAADTPARLLTARFPDYPRALQRAEVEGAFRIRFTVDVDGSVQEPVVRGDAPAALVALAVDAVRTWRFAPAVRAGAPVRSTLEQPFVFRLE